MSFLLCVQVYGYVCLINRLEGNRRDVLVDQWPDFRVVLVKPGQQEVLHKMTLAWIDWGLNITICVRITDTLLIIKLFLSNTETRLCKHLYQRRIMSQKHTNRNRRSWPETELHFKLILDFALHQYKDPQPGKHWVTLQPVIYLSRGWTTAWA